MSPVIAACSLGLRRLVIASTVGVVSTADAVTIYTLKDGSCTTDGSDGSGMEYRSHNGTCNNTGQPTWGSAGIQLLRQKGLVAYDDGISTVRASVVNSAPLAGPREISNRVVAQSSPMPNANGVSSMLMQWGQFLDHDLDLSHVDPSDRMDIPINPGDPVFGNKDDHKEGMPFSRSVYQDGVTVDGIDYPRQQVNAITAFIDGSQIYGSDADRARSLRTGLDGKLLMSEGGLLHLDADKVFFVSGDVRVNEQVGLTAMHTLFNREHNYLADMIKAGNPGLGDEQIYQEARKLNIAQMQAITYNEFLPALLGSGAPGVYSGYDKDANPGINNEFSTAAYRFGHSTLSSHLWRLDEDGNEIANGHLPLQMAFFNPSLLKDENNGGIEAILRGLAAQRAQEVDPFLVDAVRNMLFPPPVDVQFDLAALNLQRGRDHGLGSYNATRDAYGLDAVTWDDAPFLPGVKDLLKLAYTHIDDVDLWIGGLAEQHVNGGLLGELFSAIVGDQFARIRDGDRFWYENGMFEVEWLDHVRQSTLSEIVMRNTTIGFMQPNAFFVVPAPGMLALLTVGFLGLQLRMRSGSGSQS